MLKQPAELCQCFIVAKLWKLITSRGCARTDNRPDDDPLVLADSSNAGVAGTSQFHESVGTSVWVPWLLDN